MVHLSPSGAVRQLPPPKRKVTSSHLHQCRSTDQADELFRPVRMGVMLSRSSSCDDMLSLSEEAVDHPFRKV